VKAPHRCHPSEGTHDGEVAMNSLSENGVTILAKKKIGDSFILFWICFVFLYFFRNHALFFPPYWDSPLGSFHEALWLLENKFDYIKLITEAHSYSEGGPRIYVFSFYPAFQAALMSLIENQKVFLFLNHILSILLASGVVVLLYRMVKSQFSAIVALAAVGLMFFHPLFLSQAYAINMEMPVTFFGLLAVYFFIKNRHIPAGLVLLLAFWIKATALLPWLAIFLTYLLTESFWKKRSQRILGLYSLPLILFVVQNILGTLFFVTPSMNLHLIRQEGVLDRILYHFFFSAPVISFLLLVSVLGVSIMLINGFFKNPSLRKTFSQNKMIIVAIIVCFQLLGCKASMSIFLSRYYLIGIPFMFFMFIWFIEKCNQRRLYLFAIPVLYFYAISMFGSYIQFPALNSIPENNGHILERTLEYEDNMIANLELIDLLETNYKDNIIVTGAPYIHMLMSPRLGYVKNERKVFSTNLRWFTWRGVKNIRDIDFEDEAFCDKLIWVWADDCFQDSSFIPMIQNDKVLHVVERGRTRIYIIKRHPETYRLIQNELS